MAAENITADIFPSMIGVDGPRQRPTSRRRRRTRI
jgi:hypothetical protein